jgi:hypothetical protein
MKEALLILLGIFGIIIIPILIGFTFALIVGGPIYLLMKGTEYFFYFAVNPVIAEIRKVPFVGKLLCFIITLCIGLPLAVSVFIFIWLSVLQILVHAISFGAI